MSKTTIRTDISGAHATLTLTTENGINVMSTDLLHRFRGALAKVSSEKSVRTVAIVGDGKVFAAGADIKEMAAFTPEDARAYGKLGQEVLDELTGASVITVAGIHGAALGGGLELALACDFRIAVKSAKVGLPETTLGVMPGWSGIRRLSKLIGPSRAKRLVLSGIPVSAEEAHSMGFIDEIVNSAEDLQSRLPPFCKSFRRGSPGAIALAKRAWRTGDDLSAFADCFAAPDAKEGISAFVEKRLAAWME